MPCLISYEKDHARDHAAARPTMQRRARTAGGRTRQRETAAHNARPDTFLAELASRARHVRVHNDGRIPTLESTRKQSTLLLDFRQPASGRSAAQHTYTTVVCRVITATAVYSKCVRRTSGHTAASILGYNTVLTIATITATSATFDAAFSSSATISRA